MLPVTTHTLGGKTSLTVTWLPIAGYEGAYEVSSRGQVRSLDRMVPNGNGMRRAEGRVLYVYTGDHYSKVRLKLNGDGGSTKNVHQLVAEAFFGPCPEGMEVCHNNGDSHDNRVENLRYDTHVANCEDRTAAGNSGRPQQTHCKRGHTLTLDNLRIQQRPRGGILRMCRTCALAREKAKRLERKAAA